MAVEKQVYLVLGPAGAGHSTALDVFSDFGFMSIAGVNAGQLPVLLESLLQGHDSLALSVMIPCEWAQQPERLSEFAATVAELKARLGLKVLYLDAPEVTLVQRYMDSGKCHAFESAAGGLEQAVAAEKAVLGETLKKQKDYSIDTSSVSPAELRNKIAKVLGLDPGAQEMTVYVNSFGFKYGIPMDAELMFDMRFITNPFYDERLRPMTGLDQPVKDYILAQPAASLFLKQWTEMLATMLVQFQQEGKTRVTVAIGCTGGKHRSVCMTEELVNFLHQRFPDYNVQVNHRERSRWQSQILATDKPQGDSKVASAAGSGGEVR